MKKLLLLFTITSSINALGQVTDIQGNTYNTIIVGQRLWMAENLATAQFANGDTINNIQDSPTWANLTTPAWCNYDNDSALDQYHGKLYNWIAVDDSRGLCPTGWHIPTDDEWIEMEMYLGMDTVQANLNNAWRGTDEGEQLKETFGWNSSGSGTNTSGFSALPSGRRNPNGVYSDFGNEARFWTSTGALTTPFQVAYERGLYSIYTSVWRTYTDINGGMSIRCIQDGLVSQHELNERSMLVFPNPATNVVTINNPLGLESSSYSLHDLSGKVILQGNFAPGTNTIDLSKVESGLYFIKTGNSQMRIKIIKN